MRKIFILLACLFGLCLGNNPHKGENHKCGKLPQLTTELIEMSKWLVEDEDLVYVAKDSDKILGKITCVEIIECGKEKYCIVYKTPNQIISVLDSL